jgi:hypothetical protein
MQFHARHPSLVRKLPLTVARSALPLPRPLHHDGASVLELPLAFSPCIRLWKKDSTASQERLGNDQDDYDWQGMRSDGARAKR